MKDLESCVSSVKPSSFPSDKGLKPAAHVRKELSKMPREAAGSAVSSRVRKVLVRNSPREAVRIKSNMLDIFGLARQIPQCVRQTRESG